MDSTARNMVWDQRVGSSNLSTPTSNFNDLEKPGIGPCTDTCTDTPIPPVTIARFWSKVRVAKNTECWLWTGAVSRNGYGSVGVNGKSTSAHRVAYRLIRGSCPDHLLVRHKCDTPLCMNPYHLETGTHLDNSNDKVSRGRQGRQAQDGDRNHNAKLNGEAVARVRELISLGRTNVAIGKQFGVSHSMISRIRTGRSWT